MFDFFLECDIITVSDFLSLPLFCCLSILYCPPPRKGEEKGQEKGMDFVDFNHFDLIFPLLLKKLALVRNMILRIRNSNKANWLT